jgi:hypothetical protein
MHNKSLAKMAKIMDDWHDRLNKEAHLYLDAIEVVESRHGHHEVPFNQSTIGVFIRFSVMDIFLLYKMMFCTDGEQEKNVLARTLAIHIAEFIDDVGNIVGKPLADKMKKYNEDAELNDALKKVRIWYQTIKEKYDGMREIRNIVSAHKDRNVTKQLAVNEKINVDDFHTLVILNIQYFIGTYLAFENLLIRKVSEKNSMKPSESKRFNNMS